MKSLRILITNSCNASCPNCINKSARLHKDIIAVSDFVDLCSYFSSNGVSNMRIMGGEPTTHPHFQEIVEIAQRFFYRVTIFTNALNDAICNISPREQDGINYNFTFYKNLTEEKLLLDKPGTRIFEVIINSNTILDELLNELKSLSRFNLANIVVSLSLDCTENIFIHRRILIDKLETAFQVCKDMGYEVIFDHILPICFLYGTKIPLPKRGAVCNGDCSGLIDPNLNLRFCNQIVGDSYPLKENGRFIPYSIVNNYLELSHMKNQIKVLEKICLRCPFYGKHCNGGCFVHTNLISRKDIINNTDLPH